MSLAISRTGRLRVAPPRRDGEQIRLRARSMRIERAVLTGMALLALGAAGFAAYGVHRSSPTINVRLVVPSMPDGMAWKQGVRGPQTAILTDTLMTGALPDRAPDADSGVGFDPGAPAPGAAPETPLSGYVLREVRGGAALVEGPTGLRYLVHGAVLPEGARVLSIDRIGGGWVVVTSQGTISMRRE